MRSCSSQIIKRENDVSEAMRDGLPTKKRETETAASRAEWIHAIDENSEDAVDDDAACSENCWAFTAAHA